MSFEKLFFEVKELNFDNFEFSSSSSPGKINKEDTVSNFSDDQSVGISFIGPN